MKSRLIVLRGNSGSGKTTLSKALQSALPDTLLLSQDVIRREMLNVKDGPGNPAIRWIEDLVMLADGRHATILLEGILAQDWYGEMIDRLERRFTSRYAAYYFDVSFEETVRRHAMRQPTEFSETDMKRWWIDRDLRPTDRLIAENRSIESVIQMIKQEQMGEIE
ncbi:AAA family ATPase [Exiguobacterium acetylicum]|uniref:AAA family ATPase n=1 Tax=Exiguobacterium acetylicum TaxID=41170 RepID=UPI00397726CD